MNLFKKSWVEKLQHRSSFALEVTIPISNLTWMDKVIKFDLEFLVKAEKFGLFYFTENIFTDYEKQRRSMFANIIDNYIELLSLRNYFSNDIKSSYKFVGESYINLPYSFDGRIINKPTKYHQPFLDLGVLEFDNFPGVDLKEVGENENWQGYLNFSMYSSSNIWWEEISYTKDENGVVYKSDSPINNRSWAYRITPRFNSMMRDIKLITKQLGGSVLLEDYDKRFFTEDGILLDNNIIYQEDIDERRVNLLDLDYQPA